MKKQRHNEFAMCPISMVDAEVEASPEDGDESQGIGRPTLPNGTNLITVWRSFYISFKCYHLIQLDKRNKATIQTMIG